MLMRCRIFFAALLATLVLAGCENSRESSAPPRTIGISTSLPIVWPEAAEISDLLNDDLQPHWALAALQERGEVMPLDSLVGEEGAAGAGTLPLPPDALLVLAQPYPFSAQEHVALDDWVKAGGRVLLFADPMLTADSGYALGDRRRPQDIIKLAPIFGRWGLVLLFDDNQEAGVRQVSLPGTDIPVNLPGQFSVTGDEVDCSFQADGLLARCVIGKGRLLALADAALLESGDVENQELHRNALLHLFDSLEK